MARKISTILVNRTKNGLTASFLAISVCYHNSEDNKGKHIPLNIKQLVHPCTAQAIATLVEERTKEKFLTIITDNGSNIIAAFGSNDEEEQETSTEEDSQDRDEVREEYERSACA